MIVHLVDGTYELFRHFYGARRFRVAPEARSNGESRVPRGDAPFGAVVGVLGTVVQMLEDGATHVGVATDHVIESFRNDLWDGYKTGAGIEPALRAQFHPLEDALRALGIPTWAMVELEADDALASAAHVAAADARVEKVCIWTPDKDLAQCVSDRVVQMDRRSNTLRDVAGVRAKFGVDPARIADYLALVGDAADGYPGIPGCGAKTAARLINKFGPLEDFPPDVLGDKQSDAELFKRLATLRTDAPLFATVDELEWKGPAPGFHKQMQEMDGLRLVDRVAKLTNPQAKPSTRRKAASPKRQK